MRNNLFIIDTNILISSSLFKYGIPRKTVTKANQIGKLSASIETYSEFLEALLRPKFDKYLSRETRLEILLEFKIWHSSQKYQKLLQIVATQKTISFWN